MSGHNWDAYSHETLYDQIHGKAGFVGGVLLGREAGSGVSGASGAQDGWGRLAAVMENARERTEAALRRAGVEWEGSAFESMTAGITPLAQWAADSNTAGTASQSSVDAHVGAYSAARNTMPEPVRVTSTANSDVGGIPAAFTHLFGGQTDQDRQEAVAQEAKAEAVRVMHDYDHESAAAKDSVGRFVPPPSVTVTVAPTQMASTDISDSSQPWRGPDGGGGESTRASGHTSGTAVAGPTPPSVGPPSSLPATTPSGTTPAGSPPPPTSPTRTSLLNPQQPGGTPPPKQLPARHGPSDATTGHGPGSGARSFGNGGGRRAAGAAPGSPGGGRGAIPLGGGTGPMAEPAGRAGSGAGIRGGGGTGMAAAGGRNDGDEDKEHRSAEYLRSHNDSFWDDTDPVAPPVIGEDDE